MEPVQPPEDALLRPRSEAESTWINLLTLICPGSPPSEPRPPSQPRPPSEPRPLTDVQRIQQRLQATQRLLASCRSLSVSELVSQQRVACVFHLSWTTNQHRARAREAELSVPGGKALPPVNLLLIGCLTAGRDGQWRLTDGSGSVQCECLSPSPLWLDRPVLLPHWNYIPHHARQQEGAAGCLELIGPPVALGPPPEQEGAGLCGAMAVPEALEKFQRKVKGLRLSVHGRVGALCPLLTISGTTFFCFTLTDGSLSLPVLVKDSGPLCWRVCLAVGQCVCVTALRVAVLHSWGGKDVLCVSERSQLHTHCAHTHTAAPATPPPMMSQDNAEAVEEAELQDEAVQSGARRKLSRVINYEGTVTEVMSKGAGLYVIDGKVGLCLVYQPPAGRSLRAGDRVQLHHVHLLSRPCPDLPARMLCACLRSSLRVTAFSGLGGTSPSPAACPGDGVLPRLLQQSNRGVSDYLWACHLSSKLLQSLNLAGWTERCVCSLSWKLVDTLRGQQTERQRRRDFYSEMLDERHTCPLTQYDVDASVHQYLSVSELCLSLRSECWSSLSLRSLLPPDGRSLNMSQINSALSWSCRTLSSDPRTGDSLRERPLLLVGVLRLPTQASDFQQALQLSDGTGAVSCVVTETSQEDGGGQGASFNTAWIGCLVCVVRFTMVTERFLQSEFPSYENLDQDKFITHQHCRVYLQVSSDNIHILSPSVAMETHQRQQQEEEEEEEGGGSRVKRPRADEASSSSSSSVAVTTRPAGPGTCVSVVIQVEEKEGVAWRNTGVEPPEGERRAELHLSFSVRATLIGPVVSWEQDPKNQPVTDRETGRGTQDKVLLVFSGQSARWFPLLQPGRFYRLVAVNCQDPSTLIGSQLLGQRGVELHADSSLQVSSDWRFHTLTRPLHTCAQRLRPLVLSVSEVLDCRSELVCFQGLVSERISLSDSNTKTSSETGVRLTVCDQTGRSLQVYLNLSHTPYPPGLLPGNTLLLSAFQRRLSRAGSVYCTFLPVSSITVLSVADSSSAPPPPPPPPVMLVGRWSLSREQGCSVGRVKGHLVCVLFLQLQWSCSLCGSVYTQGCSSSQCRSTSSVFQSEAKVVMDDGTGEAHVWFSGASVRPLLRLAEPQWEGLQRALRVKGYIRVYSQSQSLVSDKDSEDALLQFLLCVCSSDVVSRPVHLTCRRRTNQRSEEMRRFTRGDRDFLTRLLRPLQLTCLHLHLD